MSFAAGVRVQNIKTGEYGVITHDVPDFCDVDEVIVVYDGKALGDVADTKKLKDLGPEYARADLRKCGFGQGEKCCIFVTTPRVTSGNPNDCECQRFGLERNKIIIAFNEGHTISKRWPTGPYPDCQIIK